MLYDLVQVIYIHVALILRLFPPTRKYPFLIRDMYTNTNSHYLAHHLQVAKILVESGKILTCQDLAQSSVASVARCLRLSIGFEKQVMPCDSIHF